MLHLPLKRLNLAIFFLTCLLICTTPSIATSPYSNKYFQPPRNTQTVDTSDIPFGLHFENPSSRIRRTLGMPPFLPSTNTQVDSEAFIQAFQIFKFIGGNAPTPYISADILLEQVPKYFAWGINVEASLEATRQSLLIGAIKGTFELNGLSSTFINSIQNLWHAANKIANLIERIFKGRSNKIPILQLRKAVARGQFFKSWERTNFEEPIPHLPHIYEALRQRYGMTRKVIEDPSIDPEALLQLTILFEYLNERSKSCVPTLSEINRLSSAAVQRSMLLNKNWRRFNYWTRAGMEVAIWSAFLNKPYTTITHKEQVHFILKQQFALDIISNFRPLLHEKFLQTLSEGTIRTAWIKLYYSFWEPNPSIKINGKQFRGHNGSISENWSH